MTHIDKNVESVCKEMMVRSIMGLNKYGVTTERQDLDLVQWLRHLQEELMDSVVYIEAAIAKIEAEK